MPAIPSCQDAHGPPRVRFGWQRRQAIIKQALCRARRVATPSSVLGARWAQRALLNRAESVQDGIDISASGKSLSNDIVWSGGPGGGPNSEAMVWFPLPRAQNHTFLRRIRMAGMRMHCTVELGIDGTLMEWETRQPLAHLLGWVREMIWGPDRHGSRRNIIRSGRRHSAILSDSQDFFWTLGASSHTSNLGKGWGGVYNTGRLSAGPPNLSASASFVGSGEGL